jgi:tetratricopeptide (TPR) repeat protein
LAGLFAPDMHAPATIISKTNSRDQQKSRELATLARRFMGFTAQSATGVPRPQSGIWAEIHGRLWPLRRTLRGFRHTARLALALLLLVFQGCLTRPAQAQASASSGEGWTRRLAHSHYQRALELERRGEIAQALREYSETIAIDATLGDAYLRLGALREGMGDAREAELIYSEAIRLGDSRAQALLRRSHLQRAAGRSEAAVRDLEAAVELEPNREALQELAQHYVEAHAWAAALATFRRIASSALASGDSAAADSARLEVRALRMLAAETDPSSEPVKAHDWVGRSLAHIARR